MVKKVLLLGWGHPPDIDGGLDIHVAELYKELKKVEDIDVDLAIPGFKQVKDEDIIFLDVEESEDMIWISRQLSSEVAQLSKKYDVIHTHDWFGAEAGFKAQKYSDCKWISTIHSLSFNRSRGSSPEIEKMEKLAVEKSDKLISVSNCLAQEIKSHFNVNSHIIHNGFSEPESSGLDVREKHGIGDSNLCFFVGRHAEQKGIEHLLYGFKKFLDTNGEGKLLIGGTGHMKEPLEEFRDILGLQEDVEFIGYINDEVLGDYYSAADVFVSPSINEPFGLTISEALKKETRIVATESGIQELVSDNYFIEVDPSSTSICRGIHKALQREDQLESLDMRSWEEMSSEVLNVYRSVF